MKKMIKKSIAVVLTAMIAVCMLITRAPIASAETATNVGLAAHALKAYREGWVYVWGGTSYGAVDCSGLIATYHGVGGIRVDMLASSSEWGYVSNGVPNIHGLGLHHPGHVGVYIGSGMAVDARDSYSGVVYHNVYTKKWVEWFKVAGVSYPQNGWVLLDGESFLYENGQYIVNTSRTINGVTYYFDAAGVSNIAPPASEYLATDYSTASAPVSQPNYQDNSYEEEQQRLAEEAAQKAREEEERRLAEEAEQKRLAEEAEQKRLAEEAEQKRLAEEAEQKRLAEEAEQKRLAEEAEQKRLAEEAEKKRLAEEAEKKRIEEEKKRIEEEKRLAEEKKRQEEEAVVIAEYEYEDSEESKTVTSIQTRLYELGYLSKKATGYYGGETVDAVMMFQDKNEIEVTGVVNSKTYKVLKSSKAKANFNPLEQGMFDNGPALPVTALQERLTELKYYYDDVTGFYGELTASAVRQFQKNNEIEATGVADPETQLRIFSSKAEVNPNAGGVSYGEAGAMVQNLQKRLIELRYLSGEVTGKFDDAALEAVHKYQAAAGLEESDLLTADQLEVLYSDDAVKSADYNTLRYGFSGEDVAQMQSRLASLKYYDGKTSGVYNKAVVSAVESFQKDNGLEVTGCADEKTLETLKTEAQRESTNAGDEIILKTATVSDNALAGITETEKTAEIVLTKPHDNELAKTVIALGTVIVVAFLLAAVFMIELKRKKASAKSK